MEKSLTFEIQRGSYGVNGEFNYNVQVFHNGIYAGEGRFCKTYDDIFDYIRKIKEGE